jgi:hypothetical protein
MDVYQRRRLVALSAIAIAFILLVLLIRSCGGDDDETPVSPIAGATGTGTAAALTAEQFIEEGDAICLEANNGLAEVDSADPDASATEAEILGSELGSLQTLVLADGEDGTDQLDKFLTALSDQVAALEQRATAADREDDAAVAEFDATIDEAANAASKAAGKFGFEVCGDTSEVSDGGGGGDTAPTDTGAEVPTETVPVTPTEPAPVTPTEPAPTEPTTPPADTGGADSGSGGVSP